MDQKIIAFAKEFKRLKDEHDELSGKLKEIDTLWSAAEAALLDAMLEEGVNSIDLGGVGKLSMRTVNYLSVNAANTEQFYQYLRLSGNGALLKESVNPRTLTAWLKSHLEELIAGANNNGMDAVDARTASLEFLKTKGASYFTKRGIALRKA